MAGQQVKNVTGTVTTADMWVPLICERRADVNGCAMV
jgi:hypothetical protein